MRKVLIGARRNKGEFTEGGRKIKFDNIVLYLADYREFKAHGFSFNKNAEPVKIRTVDFAEVAGVSVKDFLKNFEKEYMFHRIRVIGEENDFGRTEVIEVKFSEENCFKLWKILQEREKAAVLEEFDESEEDGDYDEDYNDSYDVSDDADGLDFEFDLNESTGEVSVKKKDAE